MEEVWKDIPGYPDYQVSNKGRVRNKGYWLEHGCRGGSRVKQYYPPKILTPEVAKKYGHQRVRIRNDNGYRRVMVHALVMEAFIGQCPDGKEVCHNDGDPSNNCLENLRYDTRSENQRDKFRQFRYDRQKLTEEDVAVIRHRLNDGDSPKDIAQDFGVGRRQIYYIRSGQHWAWSNKEAV